MNDNFSDEVVDRTARALFRRTPEGENGWQFPMNGVRDLDGARAFLAYIFAADTPTQEAPHE